GRRLSARRLMLDLPQPGSARHQQRQLGFRAVARAIVDVDDLEAHALVEVRGDFGDKRSNVAGLVAHRNNDGNRGRPAGGWFAHLNFPSARRSWSADTGAQVRTASFMGRS